MQQMLIHRVLIEKTDLASLESNVDILDSDKLKNVPTNSSNLKSKEDKLDADKLVPVPVDSRKPSDAVKNDVVKKMYIVLIPKILKIKYLILLT